MGPTDPNRYHMWTGWTGNDGQGGGPVITNAEAGYDWHTYPERLQNAGISWKVYQDIGDGLFASDTVWWGWTGDPYIGNYGDNSLLFFHQYQEAKPGNPLADFGKTGTEIKNLDRDPNRLLDIFRNDVKNGTLPQVSWIAAPEAYTEHPNFPANYGAWYISQFIEILADHPEIMSKTVFFLNYDEEGGFFDHMVPPTPPQFAEQGDSTVDTINEIYPGDASHPRAPYGLGMRVPLIVISPWTKGGWVNSQVFDHTSLIRFLEARFGDECPDLIETNITPWRRAVVGDLTSIFNFVDPNAKQTHLPDTDAFLPIDKERHPDYEVVIPDDQKMPKQERGVRPSHALPYALHAHGKANAADGTFAVDFSNIGKATAVYHVRSGNSADAPRSYTVEPNKNLPGIWNSDAGIYDLSVYGPNGFFRSFKGNTAAGNQANLEVNASYNYDKRTTRLTLGIVNLAAQSAKIRVLNKYKGKKSVKKLESGESLSGTWVLTDFYGWYDLVISVEGDTSFEYRLAGHVENGKDSYSDPLMGGFITSDGLILK
jgi:phospholipase C